MFGAAIGATIVAVVFVVVVVVVVETIETDRVGFMEESILPVLFVAWLC